MTKSITADPTVPIGCDERHSLAVVTVTVCCPSRDNARGREGRRSKGMVK